MKAGQEPSPEPPQPGTDVVPAAPKKPRKFSKLVLLTASKDSAKVEGAKRKGVHCIQRKSTHRNGDPEQPKQTNNHNDKNPRRRQG